MRMRFREIHEINEVERKRREEEERKNREFLKIKPETDITVDEAQAFWNDLFNQENIDQVEQMI